jgi:hypothetical protein
LGRWCLDRSTFVLWRRVLSSFCQPALFATACPSCGQIKNI